MWSQELASSLPRLSVPACRSAQNVAADVDSPISRVKKDCEGLGNDDGRMTVKAEKACASTRNLDAFRGVWYIATVTDAQARSSRQGSRVGSLSLLGSRDTQRATDAGQRERIDGICLSLASLADYTSA